MKRIALALFLLSAPAFAEGFYMTGQMGFTSSGDLGTLGGGATFGFDKGHILGIEAGMTYAGRGDPKVNIPFGLVVRFYDQDDIRIYMRGGAGFTAVDAMKFFLDGGIGADYFFSSMVGMGLVARYSTVFQSGADQAFVMLRVIIRFGGGHDIFDSPSVEIPSK